MKRYDLSRVIDVLVTFPYEGVALAFFGLIDQAAMQAIREERRIQNKGDVRIAILRLSGSKPEAAISPGGRQAGAAGKATDLRGTETMRHYGETVMKLSLRRQLYGSPGYGRREARALHRR